MAKKTKPKQAAVAKQKQQTVAKLPKHQNPKNKNKPLRIGLVVPHMFMHREILPRVIFAPGILALQLAKGLKNTGAEVTLFSAGPVNTAAANVTADLLYFETELKGRGDTYLDLLKKHPQTFIALARQVQSELIAKAFKMANDNELDIIHIYTNEEDIALPFTQFCNKPVIFTHHDPFNFLIKYKNVFPKYKHLNWLSMSYAQRTSMPVDTNWIGNIHHGIDKKQFKPSYNPKGGYIAYLGRIIETKGLHHAIAAIKLYNHSNAVPLKLRIAGKHYSDSTKETYWKDKIEPALRDPMIEYIGFINTTEAKQEFLGDALALIVPSTFEEPFGMVMIEALACATPVIGLDSGAIPEIIENGKTGIIVDKSSSEQAMAQNLSKAISGVMNISRKDCRQEFENRYTLERMCAEHLAIYKKLTRV